jgi:hypothetical protein
LSSILKALKKIEQEESRGGKDAHVWPDSVHSARKSVQRKKRKKYIVLFLVLFCFSLTAGIIYTGSEMNFPDKKNKSKSALNPSMKKIAEVSVAKQKKQTTKIEETNPLLVSKKKIGVDLPPVIETIGAAFQKDDNLSDIKRSKPLEPVESKPDITEPEENLPEIKNDSRLKIQAIAWAEEPSRRFAVINNSIIREGGSIDGITVISIEDDIIHFNENGNTWRQLFVIR